MVSVFLTHRRMKDSDVKSVFALTGFHPSRFLEKIDEADVKHCEKVVAVEGREGKYQEKPTPYEKYIKRDCQKQPHLSKLCYAQFVKKYYAVSKIDEDYDFSAQKVKKECDKFGKVMFENHIISVDYDESEQAAELPLFICIQSLKPGELPYMRRRSVQVLRSTRYCRFPAVGVGRRMTAPDQTATNHPEQRGFYPLRGDIRQRVVA